MGVSLCETLQSTSLVLVKSKKETNRVRFCFDMTEIMSKVMKSTFNHCTFQDGSRCSKLTPKGELVTRPYDDVGTLYDVFQKGLSVSGEIRMT